MASRSYDNSQREVAANETRERILRTACQRLVDEGYTGLAVSALAAAAQVSPQTIYNSIGGKPDVLKACYDRTIAGDARDLPLSDRPEFHAIWAATRASDFLERYAAWCGTLHERVAPILGAVLRPGATTDDAVAGFVATIDAERRTGTTTAISHLRDSFGLPRGMALSTAVDLTWTLNSPEVYLRLVQTCGWRPDEYVLWLERQLAASLLPPRSSAT